MSIADTATGETATELEADAELSTDETFELLSNRRRRYAIHHLKCEESVGLGPLSRQVAAWENDTEPSEVTSAERKRVYTSLQQFHLPKLDDKGIVTFNDREGTVTLTDAAADLDVYLEIVEGRDIPWSEYYLALSAVQVALLAAVAVNAWPFVLLPDIAWGVFAVTTTLVSALFHTYYSRSMELGAGDAPPSSEQR